MANNKKTAKLGKETEKEINISDIDVSLQKKPQEAQEQPIKRRTAGIVSWQR